jgi:ribulose-phosphate 3-epimerase
MPPVPWSDRVRTIEVEPSIYGADFARLGEQLETLLRADCRVFHFDVGDGHFIEPITMGPIVLKSISPLIHSFEGLIDVHMMVDDPVNHLAAVAEAGGDSATFHFEAVDDVAAVAGEAREHGLHVGLAFNPETAPEQAAAVAGDVDFVLCMGIHPGYSGQPFREETFERVGQLRDLLPTGVPIQVDGGVGPENIPELRKRGVTLFVAASAIFGREDLPRAYRGLVEAAA